MTGLIEDNRNRLAELCREYGVKKLEVFGSAVSSGFDGQSSDLDFLVEFVPSDPAAHARAYLGLLVAMAEQSLDPKAPVTENTVLAAIERSQGIMNGANS